MSGPAAPQLTPEQYAAAAAAFQQDKLQPEAYRRIDEERTERGERPIDLVRRYCNEILLRKGAFSPEQLREMYPTFVARYGRLFNMLMDRRFERRNLDLLLAQWEENMAGTIVDKSTADKNTEYHSKSAPFGNAMGKQFIEPIIGNGATAVAAPADRK